LIHPGVGEQQGGVVHRRQAGARHTGVASGGKEIDKALAHFGAGHFFHNVCLTFSIVSDIVTGRRSFLCILTARLIIPQSLRNGKVSVSPVG